MRDARAALAALATVHGPLLAVHFLLHKSQLVLTVYRAYCPGARGSSAEIWFCDRRITRSEVEIRRLRAGLIVRVRLAKIRVCQRAKLSHRVDLAGGCGSTEITASRRPKPDGATTAILELEVGVAAAGEQLRLLGT